MSRKYKQRGYQHEDSRSSADSTPGQPRERSEAPRGRGLGAPSLSVFRCVRCGHSLGLNAEVGLESTCEACGAALHTCTHCRYFDSSAPAECRIPGIPRVASKAKANACDKFEHRVSQETDGSAGGSSDGSNDVDDPRAQFDALFDF